MPSKKAEDLCDRGWDLIEQGKQTSDENKAKQLMRQAAAEFALALKESGGEYPRAHVGLGFTYAVSDDKERALREFNIALSQDPNHLDASVGRFLFALEEYARSWDIYTDFKPKGDNWEAEAIGKALIPGATRFDEEARRVLRSYAYQFAHTDNTEERITLAEQILGLASDLESLDDIPVAVSKSRDFYMAVVQSPWPATERETTVVEEVLHRAEGLYELHKDLPEQSTIAQWKQRQTMIQVKRGSLFAGKLVLGTIGEIAKSVFK
jgi:hypothetical protein